MTKSTFFPTLNLALLVTMTGCGATVSAPDAATDAATDTATDTPTVVANDGCAGPISCAAPPPGCHWEGPVTCSPASCGTIVCVDAGADAASDVTPDVDPDAPAILCNVTGGGAIFPPFSSSCAMDVDCVAVIHQTDCCGNLRALGILASQRSAFDAAEAVCRPMYPRCGCPTRGILADDEQYTFSAEAVGVECRMARCTTFVRGV